MARVSGICFRTGRGLAPAWAALAIAACAAAGPAEARGSDNLLGLSAAGRQVATGDPPRWAAGRAAVTITNLGVLPGGSSSSARGVSGDGSVVVGESAYRAFRWTAAGGMQNLGTSGGWSSAANGVSADGSAVVGSIGYAVGSRAFRWTAAGGMANLGTLPGGSGSEASGVSGDGAAVVGYGNTAAGNRAFLWTQAAGMADLNAWLPTLGVNLTGWVLSEATGISSDGTAIVGSGIFQGATRAWVVHGIPEPATAALLLFALGVLRNIRPPRRSTVVLDGST